MLIIKLMRIFLLQTIEIEQQNKKSTGKSEEQKLGKSSSLQMLIIENNLDLLAFNLIIENSENEHVHFQAISFIITLIHKNPKAQDFLHEKLEKNKDIKHRFISYLRSFFEENFA